MRYQEDKQLAQTPREEFAKSRQTYGVPRLQHILRKSGKNHGKTQLALLDYIEVFYNRQRIHSTLGFPTPNDFELVA